MSPVSNLNFTRIGDNNYLFNQGDVKTIVSTEEMLKEKAEVHSYLLGQCLPFLPKEGVQGHPIRVGSRQFQWVPVDVQVESSLFSRMSSAVNNFFFPPSDLGIKRYKLQEIPSQEGRQTSLGDPGKLQQETETLSASLLIAQGIEPKEVRNGVRGKMHLGTAEEQLRAARFADPYTALSALAFQRYEENFTSKDKLVPYPHSCEMCLVQVGSQLQLQYRNKAYTENNRVTVQNYYDSLVKEYGKEKIAYIEHLNQLDFNKMIHISAPLTPEHVYRVNMGLTNLESQDLEGSYKRLKAFSEQAEFLSGSEELAQLFLSKAVIFEGEEVALNGQERKALLRALSTLDNPHPTVKDFQAWVRGVDLQQRSFSDLQVSQANRLIALFALKADGRERALTGRAIFEAIRGWYNSGELEEYKPWLDQQQLIQAFSEYENSTNVEAFYEQLAFVIVKMQLVREHPTEGYRVGALIPALKNEQGEQQWYKVTSCVSNGYGNFNYTLEGVGQNSPLPPIKLYRSTATSPYCMHGQGSARSDLNPLNSPGYLGRGLGDPYEQSFFDERSIPLWVGYALEAKNKLSSPEPVATWKEVQGVADELSRATQALEQQHRRPYALMNMRQLIRKHDAILVDILSKEGRVLPTWFSDKEALAQFGEMLDQFKLKYLTSEQLSPLSEQRKDAEQLLQFLRQFAASELKPAQRLALTRLVSDLEQHIMKGGAALEYQCKQQLQLLGKEKLDELKQFETRYNSAVNNGQLDDASTVLQEWAASLENYALAKQEHPTQKKAEDILILGHSLGGSLAQLHLHHFLTDRGRIPLPHQKAIARSYDGPGINREDNRNFKKFGNQHVKLLNELGVLFGMRHSQESGDFFAFGGEEHGGATFSQEEADEVERWLDFEGKVFERKKDAKYATIAQSATAHGTRFRMGTSNQDYVETFYPSIYQGIMDRGGDLGHPGLKDVAQSMKKKVWRMDFFDAPTTEKMRSATMNTILYFLMNEKETTPKGEALFDKNGVLAVNASGVVSKSK